MGERLRILREAAHLKQSELACALNVTQATVCNWECGRYKPNVDIIPKIAKLLGCRIADIFGEE